jgi:hypothetical protein
VSSSRKDWAPQRWQAFDPFKRVRYSPGLVLGVDEFEQEQSYFRQHDWLHNRDLHGYGTVSGLQVTVSGSVVTVTKGAAVGPQGELIAMPQSQTADLNQWLEHADNLHAVRRHMAAGHGLIYVRLQAVERETDLVPILPRPLTDQEPELMPSRILDSFALAFSAVPDTRPLAQAERLFGRLLSRVRVSKSHKAITPSAMAALVRTLGEDAAASAAYDPGYIFVHPGEADEIMETALRTWVTAVKQGLPEQTSRPEAPGRSVPLAAIRFVLTGEHRATSLAVLEDDRPYLLDATLMRELVLRYRPLGDGEFLDMPEAEVRVPAMELATITRVSAAPAPVYELWFHLSGLVGPFDRSPLLADLGNLEVLAEDHSGHTGMVAFTAKVHGQGSNVFRVELEPDALQYRSLRFVFRLGTMRLESGMLLTDAMRARPVHWIGQDRYHTVTLFHRQRAEAEVMASGYVTFDGEFSGYNLQVHALGEGFFRLTFVGYNPAVIYMVRATLVGRSAGHHFRIEVLGQDPAADGLMVRVHGIDHTLPAGGFLVEITRTV